MFVLRRREALPGVAALAVLVVVLSGCGGDGNKGVFIKKTTKVTGTVLVDGVAPDSAVQVKAHPVTPNAEHPSATTGATGDDGKFEFSTYKKGDGIPPGEYKLTFMWGELNLVAMSYGGPDKLGGKYSNPQTTPFTVTVEGSSDETVQDLGTFELERVEEATPVERDR